MKALRIGQIWRWHSLELRIGDKAKVKRVTAWRALMAYIGRIRRALAVEHAATPEHIRREIRRGLLDAEVAQRDRIQARWRDARFAS